MPAPPAIVELIQAPQRGGLFGLWARPRPRLPREQDGVQLFLVARGGGGGAPRVEPLGDRSASELPHGASLVSVATAARALQCALAAVPVREDRHAWDVVFEGTWWVARPEGFLRAYALDAVTPGVPLAGESVSSWIARTLRHRVIDAVREYTIADLRDKAALPPSWWEKRFCDWLGEYGIAARIMGVRWESADAARAAEEECRAEDLSRMSSERDRQREAELEETRAQVRYEEERSQLEAGSRLSAAQKAHQMEILEERHRREILEARAAVEEARWASERASLEHERHMADLRHDLEAARGAEGRRSAAARRHEGASAQIAQARGALERLAALGKPLLRRLTDRDPFTAHQTAERLTSPEFGLSADSLEALGYALLPQSFMALLRSERGRGPAVELTMVELRARDIGTARVKALPVNSSLQFQLAAPCSGYVTLLNIGTSGTIWLQVPNPFVPPDSARVVAGRSYSVPGADLLPPERIGGYYESGPPGWEHLALLISGAPLVEPRTVQRASPDCPFVALSQDEVRALGAQIQELAQRPAIGLLSFLVEGVAP